MGGRPTKYKAEYCDIAQAVLGAGEGMAAVADEIGVTKSTVYLWAERHVDFSDAIKRGRARGERHHTRVLIGLATGKIKGNITAQIFLMKNMYPDDWKDRVEVSTTEDQMKKLEQIRKELHSAAKR